MNVVEKSSATRTENTEADAKTNGLEKIKQIISSNRSEDDATG